MKSKWLKLFAGLLFALPSFAQDLPRPATPPSSTVNSQTSLYSQWYRYGEYWAAKSAQQAATIDLLNADLADAQSKLTNLPTLSQILQKLDDVEVFINGAIKPPTAAKIANGTITWDFAGTGNTGFRIERSADGVNYTSLALLTDATARSYIDKAIPSGTWFWRVKTVYASAESLPSNVMTATIP